MPNTYITAAEIEQERTVAELNRWIEEKREEIEAREGGKEAVRLRKGLCKQLVEEVYAVSIFADHKFPNETHVTLLPVLGNQQYDVILTDQRGETPRCEYLEITQAHEGEQDFLRMLELGRKGHVWASGKVTKKRTKNTGIKISVDGSAKSMREHIERGVNLIQEAVERKTGDRYNHNTSLIVMFEDILAFRDDEGRSELDSFVKSNILSIDLHFKTLFLVGWSKQNFFEYALR